MEFEKLSSEDKSHYDLKELWEKFEALLGSLSL